MQPFPYLEILKRAYELSRKHIWLWVFGLFLGGTSMFNTGWINLFGTRIENADREQIYFFYSQIEKLASQKAEFFALLVFGLLLGLLALISFTALAYGAVIWAAGEFAKPVQRQKNLGFGAALFASRRFFWRILGLQVLATAAFALLFLILASPVVFLFAASAPGRAVVLLLLALGIFIPAAVVFGFLHLYGPICIVLFDRKIYEAVSLSFNLIRKKFKESLILAAFLLGLSLLFMVSLIFSIILMSIPIVLLIWLAQRLEFILAAEIMAVASVILASIFALALWSGFAVFQSISWVLAVQEMVRTIKTEKEEPVLAAEPAES